MSSQLLEAKLKELVQQYSDASGVESMISDIAEILKERARNSQAEYNRMVEKDSYVKELIQSDIALADALSEALDQINY